VVAVKRHGLRAAYPIFGRYLYWVLRGVVASALPGRDAARRRASILHARDHARALGYLVSDWRRLIATARHPDASTPRFEAANRAAAPDRTVDDDRYDPSTAEQHCGVSDTVSE
jgi:hypothetical protein